MQESLALEARSRPDHPARPTLAVGVSALLSDARWTFRARHSSRGQELNGQRVEILGLFEGRPMGHLTHLNHDGVGHESGHPPSGHQIVVLGVESPLSSTPVVGAKAVSVLKRPPQMPLAALVRV